MPRPATGSARWNPTALRWEARITLPGHGRKAVPMADKNGRALVPPCVDGIPLAHGRAGDCASCSMARQVAATMSARARGTGMVSGETAKTVSEWFGDYYGWREGRAKGAETVSDSRGRFRKWIEPKLGPRAMLAITRDDLERFAAYLDEQAAAGTIAPKTAINIWGEVTVGFSFAANGHNKFGKNLALRVLSADPTKGAAGPDGGSAKTKPFLRPAEIVKLLSCAKVPLERRHVYAVAIYTAMRQGELRALRVADIDLDAMQIGVARQMKSGVEKTRTKTGRARVVNIEPNLVPLLRMLTKGRGADERLLSVRAHNRCASNLRADLIASGCDRSALHVETETTAHLTFHNLRDTCLTHMAVRRDPPQDVQWRAGHTTPAMTEKYIAEARYAAGANFGEPLPPLPATLLVLTEPEPYPEPRRGRGRPPGGGGFRSRIGLSALRGPVSARKVVEAPGIEAGGGTSRAVANGRESA